MLFRSPGDLPNPGIEPRSPALQVDSLPAEPQGKPTYKEGVMNTHGAAPDGAQSSHCRVFSCCGARALEYVGCSSCGACAQQLQLLGATAQAQ